MLLYSFNISNSIISYPVFIRFKSHIILERSDRALDDGCTKLAHHFLYKWIVLHRLFGLLLAYRHISQCECIDAMMHCTQTRIDANCLTEMLGERSGQRSEEHTSELQSLMRDSYAVFCVQENQNDENKTKLI